jgi:predicted N-acetyltransferase YhbS
VGDGSGGIFVAGGPEPLPITIRLETPGDEPGVRAVELAAFTGPEEADTVDRIRDEAPPGWQSLVATDHHGRIVGHLLLSPGPVTDDEGLTVGQVLAIGPVAVMPDVQCRGVGSALMTAAMGLAIARAVPALVLLGYPSYYPRFGFSPARALGLEPPAQAWPDAAWMARRLPAWTDDLRGTVHYPEAFGPLA